MMEASSVSLLKWTDMQLSEMVSDLKYVSNINHYSDYSPWNFCEKSEFSRFCESPVTLDRLDLLQWSF